MPAFRDDSAVVLLKKIVLALGCPGVDCCGYQTEQMLLYLWARCVCGNECGGGGSGPNPQPPAENLLLLENTDPFELENGSGGILIE